MFGGEQNSGSSGVVGAAMSDLSRRLSKIEDAAKIPRLPAEKQSGMDVFKALAASWPAFGLVALVLASPPQRPFKVWELSFTNRLESSASRPGEAGLAGTIPKLSPLVVDFLLRANVNA